MRILYHGRKAVYANSIYGLLYNWYAATDARNIAPAGWHVPTKEEIYSLMLSIDPDGEHDNNDAGGKMKETGLTYWQTPNTGATNETGFNGRGSGLRTNLGIYKQLNAFIWMWTSTEVPIFPSNAWVGRLISNSAVFDVSIGYNGILWDKIVGISIRLIKDDSTNTGTMTDNNGFIYQTVKIGDQVWMAANLKTTKYRNGDAIPEVTDNDEWKALTTGALCAYNNDWNNV